MTSLSDSPLVVVGNNIPVGYTVPVFPSLYFPTADATQFNLAYLYYSGDIWRFTVYWTMIFYVGFHLASAMLAMAMHGRIVGSLWILAVYAGVAGFRGLVSGSVVGGLVAAIYKAGMFGVSTWIPFVWGLLQIVFMVITSYSMMSAVL